MHLSSAESDRKTPNKQTQIVENPVNDFWRKTKIWTKLDVTFWGVFDDMLCYAENETFEH